MGFPPITQKINHQSTHTRKTIQDPARFRNCIKSKAERAPPIAPIEGDLELAEEVLVHGESTVIPSVSRKDEPWHVHEEVHVDICIRLAYVSDRDGVRSIGQAGLVPHKDLRELECLINEYF